MFGVHLDAGFVSVLCGEGKSSGVAVQDSRFQKKQNGSAGVRRSGSGRGRGLGFLAGRGFGESGEAVESGGETWRRGVCGAGLCVCGKKKERRGV